MESFAIYQYFLIVTQYMMMRSKQQAAIAFLFNIHRHFLSMIMSCKAGALIIPIFYYAQQVLLKSFLLINRDIDE